MSPADDQNRTGFRRLVRMQRVASHAAELLEAQAKSLYECHTLDNEWDDDEAKAMHEDLMQTASDLRKVTGAVQNDRKRIQKHTADGT